MGSGLLTPDPEQVWLRSLGRGSHPFLWERQQLPREAHLCPGPWCGGPPEPLWAFEQRDQLVPGLSPCASLRVCPKSPGPGRPAEGLPLPPGGAPLTLPFPRLQKPSVFDVSRELGPSVSLYSRKVLIQTKATNILPTWLRFVRGLEPEPVRGRVILGAHLS